MGPEDTAGAEITGGEAGMSVTGGADDALTSGESATGGVSDGGSHSNPSNPVYHADVMPILERACIHCHTEGGAGLFDLRGYENASMWGPAIVEATQSLRMPPWGAFETETCTPSRPWREDQRLSEEELSTLAEWVAAGSPEGDVAHSGPVTPFIPHELERVDFEGRAQASVDVPAGDDSFICVIIDPELTEETWLRGIEFIPDNEALVHHVVLFTDPNRASLELADDSGVYPCFGSPRVPGTVAAAWAPGIQPNVLPVDHAMRIQAGTLFVMQMHYSPQGGADELRDQTTVRFQYADEPPRYEAYLQLMGNLDFTIHPALGLQPSPEDVDAGLDPSFVIPAGAQDHVETIRWTYSGNLPGGLDGGGPEGLNQLRLLSISPHMHYAGVGMEVHLDRPAPGEGACAPGSLTGFFACAASQGCLDSENPLECFQEKCTPQWDNLSLSCWGCAHQVFVSDAPRDEATAMISACERPDMTREALSGEPANECLVSAPRYDFEWQRSYRYDVEISELPTFIPGDVLSIECHYQNSLENPQMRAALSRAGQTAPQEVRLGEETLDEMCLVGLLFSFERPN